MTHYTTEGLDMYIAEHETPSGNWGRRASCPQIPGCVVVSGRRELAISLVNDSIEAVAAEGSVVDVRA